MSKNVILTATITSFIILTASFLVYFPLANVDGSLPTSTTTISENTQNTIPHIFFKDSYSSSSRWTQIGTSVTVNSPSFPGVVKFNNAIDGGGVTDNRIFKQLPATLVTEHWIADFNYKFTASSIPAAYPLALTTSSANPEQPGTGSAIRVYHGDNSDVLHIWTWNGTTGASSPGLYTGIPIFPNTQYFIKLERTPTHLVLGIFSDPARTIQVPGSPVTLAIATTDFQNLNFIQHSTSLSSGPARTLTAQVDNTIIFVN